MAFAGGLALVASAAGSSTAAAASGPATVVSLKTGRRYRVTGRIAPPVVSSEEIEGFKRTVAALHLTNASTDGEHFSFEGAPVSARDVTVNSPIPLPPPYDAWSVTFTSIEDLGPSIAGDDAGRELGPSPLAGFFRVVLGF
ncbi:MAG TPA: hypothetical protein VF420_13220 [Casimicrobiaceae bacterium]